MSLGELCAKTFDQKITNLQNRLRDLKDTEKKIQGTDASSQIQQQVVRDQIQASSRELQILEQAKEVLNSCIKAAMAQTDLARDNAIITLHAKLQAAEATIATLRKTN